MAKIYNLLLCAGASCISSGGYSFRDKLVEELKKHKLEGMVNIVETGCVGICELGPVVIVYPDGVFYKKLKPEDAKDIVEEHLLKGRVVQRLLYKEKDSEKIVQQAAQIPFFQKQLKIVLRNCGIIDPESLEEYIGKDGYSALAKVLTEMSPEDVIKEIKDSGLRGRGGAGFPTGLKWELVRNSKGDEKYVVCNADEGDPGAFMDRSVLEGDPFSVIEAMTIAGYAVGAKQGYVYVRAEYPLAIKRLKSAIKKAYEENLLGKNIFGKGLDFDLEIRVGAGAFVCGEETALMHSIEGQRGTPSPKPPFPADKGLFGKPTLINNVETYANICQIILKGSKWFSSIGTEKSKGTKVFALAGEINNTGLVEVPMGTTLREMVYEIGGGLPNNKKFKAAQIGGPSGGCIPAEFIDTPLDYESVKKLGTIIGSGGLIIMSEDTCMVDLAKYFLEFTQDESCGKCPPCRIGTKKMLEILDRISKGRAKVEELDLLIHLGEQICKTSLCGLGQTAPNPVLSTIRYFKDEYLEHINEKKCRAGICFKKKK
jgi:NADP-reducing hydrogenase subunit HndC